MLIARQVAVWLRSGVFPLLMPAGLLRGRRFLAVVDVDGRQVVLGKFRSVDAAAETACRARANLDLAQQPAPYS